MRLLYIANIRLPTEKAHGVQILKTCEAFASAGVEVELVVTDRRTPIVEDPFAYYGITKKFTITRLPVLDTVGWGRAGFWLESLSFARQVRRYLKSQTYDVVYGRDELILWRMPRAARLVWEPHTGAWNRAARSVARRAHKLVVISQGLKDFYVARGVPAEKIVVAPDGVDMERFGVSLSRAEARAKLAISSDKPLVLYTGSTQPYKGVDTLKRAQALLPDIDVRFVWGRPYTEMPLWMRAADILILPTSAHSQVSRSFTSPMKLFEYMASGTPIVASDVASSREVLDDTSAYFFDPDNPESLAKVIHESLADPGAPLRAARAKELVRAYTWDARAHIILSYIA